MSKIISLSNITLLVALALSTVAAYYSIIGLTAIFAGAVIPIIIMGSILEIGKITTTVWLRKYWKQCSLYLKLYLVPAVVLLAILTSMGIFGFLSKAHMDSGLVSGDVQAKLALIDEKIKTQRDNIEVARKALQQMDAQVDARLSRGDSEQSAERAVQIRRQQAGERAKLQKDIGDAQQIISKLNEERAPIAAENRKVEAEVGPIKYVAALIYGDNPDSNLLERAVRWVIILLVIVFDPLAIALVLAANASREWDKKLQDDVAAMGIVPPKDDETRPFTEEEITALDAKEPVISKEEKEMITDLIKKETSDDVVINEVTHPYLYKTGGGFKNLKPMVYKEEPTTQPVSDPLPPIVEPAIETTDSDILPELAKEEPVEQVTEVIEEQKEEVKLITEDELASTHEYRADAVIKELDGGYVLYDGKSIAKNALKEIKPELFRLTADSALPVTTKFGTQFPKLANKGDMFIRVDVLPNRLFKFDGRRWFEVNKESLDSYLEVDYIKFLISKIETGEYDVETLTEKEREQIESYLNSNK